LVIENLSLAIENPSSNSKRQIFSFQFSIAFKAAPPGRYFDPV